MRESRTASYYPGTGARIRRITVSGLLAGIFLGLFFKAAEAWSSIPVYRLLLAVDYVPVLRDVLTAEWAQFGLHLLISLAFAGAAGTWALRLKANRVRRRLILGAGIAVGILLYPTTMLSAGTPGLTDPAAVLLWLAGHAGYGWLCGRLLFPVRRER